MLGFFRRKADLARKIEGLLGADLDRAAEELSTHRKRLRPRDASRLAATIRRRLQAREHVEFLSHGLAQGRITPIAACELLETYGEAGYLEDAQSEMLRRHIVEAHRREVIALLASESASSSDYFRTLDAYRAAGYLSEEELDGLRHLVDAKLDPVMAARRLFARARTEAELSLQKSMLERYLLEFEGFPDYPEAASLFLSLRVDHLWKTLPTVRYAREAAIAVHELNNLLIAYLPYTDDISDEVPVDRIVQDFMRLAKEFKPEPDVEGPITVRHLRRKVVVTDKQPALEGTYEYERNELVSIGAKGRVVAVRPERIMVAHQGQGLPYSQSWPQPQFAGSQHAKVHPRSSLASWQQEELGLVKHKRPSPVFVHQYQEAVKKMGELLEQHRQDQSQLLTPPSTGSLPPAGNP